MINRNDEEWQSLRNAQNNLATLTYLFSFFHYSGVIINCFRSVNRNTATFSILVTLAPKNSNDELKNLQMFMENENGIKTSINDFFRKKHFDLVKLFSQQIYSINKKESYGIWDQTSMAPLHLKS